MMGDCTQFKIILSIFSTSTAFISACIIQTNGGKYVNINNWEKHSAGANYTTTQVHRTSSKSYESPLWNQRWSILAEWRLKIPGFVAGCSCDPIGCGRWAGKHLQSQRNRTPYQCRYVVGPLLYQTNRVQINYTQDLIINGIWFIAYMIDYRNFKKTFVLNVFVCKILSLNIFVVCGNPQ